MVAGESWKIDSSIQIFSIDFGCHMSSKQLDNFKEQFVFLKVKIPDYAAIL